MAQDYQFFGGKQKKPRLGTKRQEGWKITEEFTSFLTHQEANLTYNSEPLFIPILTVIDKQGLKSINVRNYSWSIKIPTFADCQFYRFFKECNSEVKFKIWV